METRYKNYRIEAYQTEIRRWRARIRRLDGKKVKGRHRGVTLVSSPQGCPAIFSRIRLTRA